MNVCVATATRSFQEAAKILVMTAEVTISPRHLQNLCHEVGDELVAERDQRTQILTDRPLTTPPTPACPPIPLAVVMVDGGRIQTRQPNQGPGVHDPAWRETKTAILLRMTHQTHAGDPHPDLPRCFAHATDGPSEPSVNSEDELANRPPEILVRTGLATLSDSQKFGHQVAAAADDRGFFSAANAAYLGDGLAYNWSIHRRHFGRFEPILDFVHAAQHVHQAAAATGVAGEAWVRDCWQGRTAEVIAAIAAWRSRLTPPTDAEAEPDHPWCVLGREEGYLRTNLTRMSYPRYRQAGLPITSSPVESWVKQLNQRVKGSERFWNADDRAEAILHLRAAWLSDDEALTKHLQARPGQSHARPRTLKAA